MTWLRFASTTLSTLATLLMAFVLLSVHSKIRQDTKIDPDVVAALDRNEIIVLISVCLLVLSYALDVIDSFRTLLEKDRRKQIHERMYAGQVKTGTSDHSVKSRS